MSESYIMTSRYTDEQFTNLNQSFTSLASDTLLKLPLRGSATATELGKRSSFSFFFFSLTVFCHVEFFFVDFVSSR